MTAVRAAFRLLRALAHAIHGWWIIRRRFPSLDEPGREDEVQRWATRMLAILGVDLRVEGEPPDRGPVLLVSNHISWLDILVLHAARHCRFVSKSDVKHWPLIGPLATGAGTLYIERESRRDAMRVVHHMAQRLQAGDIIAIFPEGTTSDGRQLLPFHANLIQSAISAHAPAQPVRLAFVDKATGARSDGPRYIDEDTLLSSVWRTASSARIDAVVRFGHPQLAQGRDRRTWAADLRQAVEALGGAG
jgi:1-acyl-sn-glycerol-3-phosphate acyltransferase